MSTATSEQTQLSGWMNAILLMLKIGTNSFTTVVLQYKQLVDYLKEIHNIFVSITCEKVRQA